MEKREKKKHSCSYSPHVHDLRVKKSVNKGLLKFTSYTAGAMAAFGNLLGRHNKVTLWFSSGLAAEQDMAAPSAVPLSVVYYIINLPTVR